MDEVEFISIPIPAIGNIHTRAPHSGIALIRAAHLQHFRMPLVDLLDRCSIKRNHRAIAAGCRFLVEWFRNNKQWSTDTPTPASKSIGGVNFLGTHFTHQGIIEFDGAFEIVRSNCEVTDHVLIYLGGMPESLYAELDLVPSVGVLQTNAIRTVCHTGTIESTNSWWIR